jgi:tetratricopeptide (TPR) repeat protein
MRYASGGRTRDYWGSYGLFLCGLLSKSIAAVFPLALILYDLCLARRGWRPWEKIPYFAASMIFGAFTLYGEGGRAGAIVEYAGGSPWINLLYTARVYVDYLLSLLFPFQLSPYYHYQAGDLENWRSFCSYLLVPFAITVIAANWRMRPQLAFAAGWFVIWLLPVSNIIPLNTLRQDRYLYLAALAPFVALLRAASNHRWIRFSPARGWLCSGILLAALTLVTVPYMATFADGKAYWLRVAKICPNWAAAQYEAGVAVWSAGDADEAAAYYRKAVRADPSYSLAWNNLGAIWLDRGRYRLAEIYGKKAIATDPNNIAAYRNLAAIAAKTGGEPAEINAWLKKSEEISAASREKDYNLDGPRFHR